MYLGTYASALTPGQCIREMKFGGDTKSPTKKQNMISRVLWWLFRTEVFHAVSWFACLGFQWKIEMFCGKQNYFMNNSLQLKAHLSAAKHLDVELFSFFQLGQM